MTCGRQFAQVSPVALGVATTVKNVQVICTERAQDWASACGARRPGPA
jgi:hypothetical protein